MLRFLSILFVFFCFCNSSLSQNSINENSINSIFDNEYFNNYSLENFYLHTNKSIYFSQEEIFFKAYVVHEEDNKPFVETTNLHISLYDFNNKLVLSELFYVNKGTSYGSIAIPEDIKTGNYTIQLNTQWNKNFKGGSLFPIQIYNINNTSLETAKNEKLNITKKIQVVKSFQDNNSGYHLIKSKSKNSEIVRFQLKLNNETIAAEKDEFIYAISHKKGTTKSVAPIKLLNNIKTYNLHFYKDSLFQGFNSITVFNKQNKILAENNYFNKPKKEIDISTSIIKETNDSISLDIKLLNIAKETNISISVLYEQTKALDTNTTITKRFLESPERTDGFNAFPYKNRANREPVLENENGLKLSGSVNTKIDNTSSYKVMLTSQANNLLVTSPISSDKKFEFKNLLLKHPSDYKLALVNKNREVIKGEFFIYKNFVTFKADSLLNNNPVNKLEKTPIILEEKEEATNKTINYFPVNKEVEQLEEVFLKSVINKKEERIIEIKDENPFLGISTSFSKDYLVDLDKDYVLTLRQYLQRIPSIYVAESSFEKLIVNTRRISTITGDSSVLFILDGTPLDAERGLDIGHLNVTDFELISVNISGSGYGIQGANGVINLISRNHVASNNNTNTLVKEYQTSLGFNFDKSSLENSKLVFPNLQSSYYYKTIDWVPNFTLRPNNSNILKIKKPKNENVKLIINGFNNDGDLIYKVIEL
ncbi:MULTISPECIES: hypothetical protein [unclassified Lacinutrix]